MRTNGVVVPSPFLNHNPSLGPTPELFHRFVAQTMQGTDKSLGFGWGEGDNSRRMPPAGLGELLPLPELQSRHDPCSGAHGTTVANTSVQAPQAEAARRLPGISQSGALQQVWIGQSAHLRRMDERCAGKTACTV